MNNPEKKSRENINLQLENQGWSHLEEKEGTGYKEEVVTETGKRADYVLYVQGEPIAVIEAKKQSIDPLEKREQGRTYAKELDNNNNYLGKYSVPFVYTSNGKTIVFDDLRAKARKFREVYSFHTPEDLQQVLKKNYPEILEQLSEIDSEDIDKKLWDNQKEGFNRGMNEIVNQSNKILYQMATGSGKTRMAIAISYALLQEDYADRILFAVDTKQLRRDTIQDYRAYKPVGSPDFQEKYIANSLDEYETEDSDVVVTTTQKLSRRLEGEDHSHTIGEFDVVIADEAHRGIFNEDGLALSLDYFDALEIGLTATPHKKTKERYNGNLIYTYNYQDALDDNKVAPFNGYSIDTKIMTEDGIIDDGKMYTPDQIGSDVIVEDTHRKVAQKVKEITDVENELTLVFAQNTDHAETIKENLREEYDELFDDPREAIQRVTGKDYKPDITLSEFKDQFRPPYIIVTVDMVTTGIDIRPLNNIILLRPIKSKILFNQMMGRGTRTHESKTHFKIFDCVSAFDYHNDVPPFATEDMDMSVTHDSNTDSKTTTEPQSDPKIIKEKDIDEIVQTREVFPSKSNEWVDRREYIDEVKQAIKEHKSDIISVTNNCNKISDCSEEIETILRQDWKLYTEQNILHAIGDPNIDSLYALCLRTLRGYETVQTQAQEAKQETVRKHNLSDNAQEIVQAVSERAAVTESEITKDDFLNPPLSTKHNLREVKSEIADLDAVLDTFNKEFLSLE